MNGLSAAPVSPVTYDPNAKYAAGDDHWMQQTPQEVQALLASGGSADPASYGSGLTNAPDGTLHDGSHWRQWLFRGDWYGRQMVSQHTQYFFKWILGRASSEAASATATAANQANMGTDAQRIRAAQLRYMAQGMSEQDAASRAYGEFAQGRLAGVPRGFGTDPSPPPLPPVLPPVTPSSAVTTTPATTPTTPASTAVTTPTNYTVPIVIGVAVVGIGVAVLMTRSGRKRRKRRGR